jgi:hypothetical protein
MRDLMGRAWKASRAANAQNEEEPAAGRRAFDGNNRTGFRRRSGLNHFFEIDQDLTGVSVPPLRLFLQALHDDPGQRGWNFGIRLAGIPGRLESDVYGQSGGA